MSQVVQYFVHPLESAAPAAATAAGPALPASGGKLRWIVKESWWKRLPFTLAALVLTGTFARLMCDHWVPAHGGVDQNGYMVGGKQMAQTGTTKIAPRDPDTGEVDPFQFVGAMWVGVDLGTPVERFYPKYPIGLPAMVALARQLGGQRHAVDFAYIINPAAMTLAVLGTFFLARAVIGSFIGILAAAIMATTPVTLLLANNPSSHATTVAFVTWGVLLLLRWWQSGGALRAAGAGFCLGYAYTIRYTEGLLLLPLLAVVVLNLRWRQLRCWLEAGLALTWWALPVLVLTCFNLKAMGTLTGYDPTHESTGFKWEYFIGDEFFTGNWDTLLRQFNSQGLFLIFPLAVVGLVWMWVWNWRVALLLTAWIVPNSAIYLFYYWAPDGAGTGYLRFFLTVVPGLVLCAFWLLNRLCHATPEVPGHWVRASVGAVVLGILTALSVLINLRSALVPLEGEQRGQLQLVRAAQEIAGYKSIPPAVPPGSVLFAASHLLHHIQFVGDYQLYCPQIFSETTIKSGLRQDPEEAHPLHRQRSQTIVDRLGSNFGQPELSQRQRRIIQSALEHKRRVFFAFHSAAGQAVIRADQAMANALAQLLPGTGAAWVQKHLNTRIVRRWSDPNRPSKPVQARPGVRRRRPEPPKSDPNLANWILLEVTAKPGAFEPPPPPPAPAPPVPQPAAVRFPSTGPATPATTRAASTLPASAPTTARAK